MEITNRKQSIMTREELNLLSRKVIDTAILVHKKIGPGLLEPIYRKALALELRKQGFKADEEVPFKCIYEGVDLGLAFRADIIVEDELIIELKSTEVNHPVYFKQLLSYLKVANKRLGLLLNFSYPVLTEGMKRMVNNF